MLLGEIVEKDGMICLQTSPLNSREPWPLWCEDASGEICLEVFDSVGNLSADFLEFVK